MIIYHVKTSLINIDIEPVTVCSVERNSSSFQHLTESVDLVHECVHDSDRLYGVWKTDRQPKQHTKHISHRKL